MEMIEKAKQLAIDNNLSRIIESFVTSKDGKSTIVITIYQKSVDGQYTCRVEKYYYFFTVKDSSHSMNEKVEKAKAKATFEFLNYDYKDEDKDGPEPEPEPPKPEPKPEPEKPKEEPKPKPKPKPKSKAKAKSKGAFKEVLGEEEPKPFIAKDEPEAVIDIESNVKTTKPQKTKSYNIKYDKKNKTHVAFLKDVLVDELGPDYIEHKAKIITFIKDKLHDQMDCTDKNGLMMQSFSKFVREHARKW